MANGLCTDCKEKLTLDNAPASHVKRGRGRCRKCRRIHDESKRDSLRTYQARRDLEHKDEKIYKRKEREMWMWDGWSRLVEIEAPNRIDKVLVAAGLSASVSEATRLIKNNGVTVDHERVTNPKFAIPTGKPVLLKVGKSSWRLVPREGRPGWDGFPAWRDVMFPQEFQEFEFWKTL